MTDFDSIWRTQDEIRTVVNAVLGECMGQRINLVGRACTVKRILLPLWHEIRNPIACILPDVLIDNFDVVNFVSEKPIIYLANKTIYFIYGMYVMIIKTYYYKTKKEQHHNEENLWASDITSCHLFQCNDCSARSPTPFQTPC